MTEKMIPMDDAESAIATLRQNRRPMVKDFIYSGPVVPILAAGGTSHFTISTYSDSFFVVKKMMINSSTTSARRDLSVRIFNGSTGRSLMSAPIRFPAIFGGFQPLNFIKDPIVLPPSSNLEFSIKNEDATDPSAAFQVSLWGYRWFDLSRYPIPSKVGSRLDWFQLAFGDGGLIVLPTGQGTYTARVDADADFLVRKIVGSNVSSGGFIVGNIQISDSASADTWQDNLVPAEIVVGNANAPAWLQKPRLIRRNSTISLTIVGSTQDDAQLVLEGAKVYNG